MSTPISRTCACCGAILEDAHVGEHCARCLANVSLVSAAEFISSLPSEKRVAAATAKFPIKFGDYELLEELGRGGMGVVYRAFQPSLNRIVAIKVLLAGRFTDEESKQRFLKEAEIISLLQHPNIVTIYEVGTAQNLHYFTMEYVQGSNLATLIRQCPIRMDRVVRYIQTVAAAIHYINNKGVVHRDLKPSNILIDQSDQPHITDFGLARRFEGKDTITRTGQILGSPNYLPPERVSSAFGRGGVGMDVYGLGAVLYHCLTGRPPFTSKSAQELLWQVAYQNPPRPRTFNPNVPPELETICLKCLRKIPRTRYASAADLATDLQLWWEGRPVLARNLGPMERMEAWLRPYISRLKLPQ